MPIILDRDFRAIFAERFAGRLFSATLSRVISDAVVDPLDAAGPPTTTAQLYTCEGAAFAYKTEYVDGEQVKMTQYRVMLLLGSFAAVADDAEAAVLDLATVAGVVDTVVRARARGAGGNLITIEFVGDVSFPAGAIVEVGTNVRIRFQPGASRVSDIEALIAQSSLLEVATPGTAGNVLDVTDTFASTALAGGVDATETPATDTVPRPGDIISIPPPAQTVAQQCLVLAIETLTNAAVTCRVAGQVF